MTEPSQDKHKQLAVRIADNATDTEKEALRIWIEKMLAIKESDLPRQVKARKAYAVTSESKVILPTLKIVGRQTKRLGWDDRSTIGRLGLIGAGVGAAVFGSQSAGIAALGGAIGVPLWVIFGAGAAFVGLLYEEITGEKPNTKTSYNIIDADEEKD